jgi:hypothetical protein
VEKVVWAPFASYDFKWNAFPPVSHRNQLFIHFFFVSFSSLCNFKEEYQKKIKEIGGRRFFSPWPQVISSIDIDEPKQKENKLNR